MSTTQPCDDSIERIARESYGRLVAFLASRSGNIADAEDALSEAFASALRTWPNDGVPDRPESWLLKAASRNTIDAARRRQTRVNAHQSLEQMAARKQNLQSGDEDEIPDTRLRLLFVCAHPAIDAQTRTPLMLQTVLGLDAARIASAFLVKPSAMSARLVRAKNKIRDAAIPFVVPAIEELDARLPPVFEAIYAAFTIGCDIDGHTTESGLASEAIWLGSILNRLLPNQPEAMGLQAMMLFRHARTRPTTNGSHPYLPLSDQPTTNWNPDMIADAERILHGASKFQSIGPYQLEAAIQAVHCDRLRTGETDWSAIRQLYTGLDQISPTTATTIGLAAAQSQCDQPHKALQTLEKLPTDIRNKSAPYWAVLAKVQTQLNNVNSARTAYDRAIGLTESEPVRAWLLTQRQ